VSPGLAGPLNADGVAAVADGESVELDGAALAAVAANRGVLERLIAAETPIYGITTGFGALVRRRVSPADQRLLQLNLLRSHAAGVGELLPREVVRAAMVIRAGSLLRAHSGVRPMLIERIVAFLNAGLTPEVPRTGSLGASGDLAPSAHAFLPLVGQGWVRDDDGARLDGAAACARLGVEPLALEPKEGLALINGTHFMAAIGALLTRSACALLDTLDLAAAMTIDALRGAAPAFEPRVHALRPVPGQQTSAARLHTALRGSGRVTGEDEPQRQDPYSLRCAAQVHGAAREAVAFFARLVAIDLEAVTDNPLVFDDPPGVISAGNFHGQSLALAFDTLKLALADLGAISERRVFRLLSPSLNEDLPAFLSATAGLSSGYMIAQYTAAALVSELRALAHPVSVDTIPTSDNQEDHVAMGMTAALMAWDAMPRLQRVVACELLCGAQALDCDPGQESPTVGAVHAAVRERVPVLVEDRPPADDIEALVGLVAGGGLAAHGALTA
jgi:histidine ammonia-lyase